MLSRIRQLKWDLRSARYLCAISLVLLPIALNAMSLRDGHNIGDDFAQYIICAQNILSGKPYSQGVMLGLPVIFPPAYSLVLAPFIFFFGVNFLILKSLNIVFMALLVWGAYRTAKGRAGQVRAYFAALFIAWMSYFFFHNQNIISDLPFSTVAVWAVYYLERYDVRSRSRDMWRSAGLMSLALLTRSAGTALFLGALIYRILSRQGQHRGRDLLALVAVFCATVIFQNSFFGSAPGVWSAIIHYAFWIPMIILNKLFYISPALLWVIVPPYTGLNSALYAYPLVFPFLSGALVLVFTGAFIWQAIRRSLTPLFAIFFVYFSLVVLWTVTYEGHVENFSRFMLPAVPLLIVWIMDVLARYHSLTLHSLARALFLLFFVLNVWNVICVRDFSDDVTRDPEMQGLVAWVKTHVAQDEGVLFFRPRFLSLMAGVKSGVGGNHEDEISEQWLAENNIRYAVTFRRVDCIISRLIASRPYLFELEWKNREYRAYRFTGFKRSASP